MQNLAQKAHAGRLSALQYLAALNNDATDQKFSSVFIEFDRISRDPRLSSIASKSDRYENSNRPLFKSSRPTNAVA